MWRIYCLGLLDVEAHALVGLLVGADPAVDDGAGRGHGIRIAYRVLRVSTPILGDGASGVALRMRQFHAVMSDARFMRTKARVEVSPVQRGFGIH